MSKKNIFVFVACGDKQINQLNFSIQYLKQFSKNEIIVVTDTSGKKSDILHDNIAEVETPQNLSHEKASVFIKTGLHKILDMSHDYCYLSPHVVAVRKGVDKVFNHKYGKITFSPDFLKINEMSPYLVNCDCLKRKSEEISELEEFIIKNKDFRDFGKTLSSVLEEERSFFRRIKIRFVAYIQVWIKKILLKHLYESRYYHENKGKINVLKLIKIKFFDNIHITEHWLFSTFNNAWLDNNEMMYCEHLSFYDFIKRKTGFSFDKNSGKWFNRNGKEVYSAPTCNHMLEFINTEFRVKIPKNNWQHWSSDMFLFNSESVEFLETWHEFTLKTLIDEKWKGNDISSLAATIWKYKFNNKKKIPTEFQLIADIRVNNVKYEGNQVYSINEGKSSIQPYFINAGDGFGNMDWEIWRSIVEKLES